jgi:hypothetical protein
MHAWVYPGLYQTGWRRVVRDWALEVILARLVHIAIALSRRKRET